MEVPEKKITRSDLPAVVKRAAELAQRDADLEEEISEEEVVRIAAELGLPARHVKAALYEGAREEPAPGFLDRQFGTPRIVAVRAVPIPADRARRALEEYFTTQEYMSVVRRQADSFTLEPATDTVTRIARKFKRGSKHQLASAEVLEVTVRPLEEGWSHVRMRAVFKDARRGQVAGAVVGGVLLGIPSGILFGALGGAISHEVAGAFITGTIAAAGAGAGIYTGIMSSLRKHYREWRERTVMHSEGVLDRLEKGEEIRSPASPWLRTLQKKLDEFGF